jgi:hypothetical protein
VKLTNVLISLLSSSAEGETAEKIMRSASEATVVKASLTLAQTIVPDTLDTEKVGLG